MDNTFTFRAYDFPNQKVPADKKDKVWAMNCCDFVIAAGMQCNDRAHDELLLDILHGNIPAEFYKKTLNPYNAEKEKYTRFPATMRNLDIINDIVRRYVSEYVSANHEFIVGANNPEIVLQRDNALQQDILQKAMIAYQQELQSRVEQARQGAIQQGQDPNTIDMQQLTSDAQEFEKTFVNNYVDNISAQAADLLNVLDDILDNETIFPKAFFDFVVLGEAYSYHDVRGKEIIKEVVPVTEMYPVPNGKQFVEDYDFCARRTFVSYAQILDRFQDTIEEKDLEFIRTYYNPTADRKPVTLSDYQYYFPDKCGKGGEDNKLFKNFQPINLYDLNGGLVELWHSTWRGFARRGLVTYINESGFLSTKVVDEDYEMIEGIDLEIEYEYEPQIYEAYRIGNNQTGIYPIKGGFRAIPYNREPDYKLPYTGIQEIVPQFGKFSLVEMLTPFQVLINIFSYHREMMLAKNKMFMLMMAKSLFGTDAEETIYRMAADGMFIYDDTEDTNSLKAQQVRMLNANISGYIREITDLINDIKFTAREMVDMNPQRYGEIANSAGAQTTREAIMRGSMGSVIITFMFDKFRSHDYQADLDYSKLAWIDGLDTSYFDKTGNRKYLSLDVNSHVHSRYMVYAKNTQQQKEQLEQLKQWAFSAAQNGDLDMALAAITETSTVAIKQKIEEFGNIKRQHEEQLKQMDAQIQEAAQQFKLQEIQAKGEQDRLSIELQEYYELQKAGMDVANNIGSASVTSSSDTGEVERAKTNQAQIKANTDIDKARLDFVNKALDRDLKRKEMESNEKIAKINKNKYDK
jgi:hypothetical protein